MPSPIKLGITKETKIPPDTRVPLTPAQCAEAVRKFPQLELVVQSSLCHSTVDCNLRSGRCFNDDEYKAFNVDVVESLDDCDIILGVKEVQPSLLIPDKTYLFFSHTIKKQIFNRQLLREVLNRRIRLVDYELLVNDSGARVIAFGRWAGIVGAHNALYTWAKRRNIPTLPRLKDITGGYKEAGRLHYPNYGTKLKSVRIVLTGDGRVSSGCVEVFEACGIRRVTPEDFLNDTSVESCPDAVFCQLPADKLYGKPRKLNGVLIDGMDWDEGFFNDPTGYESRLSPYLRSADVLINGIYWDQRTAPLFTIEEMRHPEFRVRVISDITCDLVPNSSIPATIKASTINDPIFGFNPHTGLEVNIEKEDATNDNVWMTTINNLPNELPQESSEEFGRTIINAIIPQLLINGVLVQRATIADKGKLLPNFSYLQSFVDGH